jgi:hypothetical protein
MWWKTQLFEGTDAFDRIIGEMGCRDSDQLGKKRSGL